jgi:hypothetical protein
LTPTLNWSAYSQRKMWNQATNTTGWAENSNEAYSSGLANLATALGNWNASKTGKRRGPKVRFPRFTGKRHGMSCRFTTGVFGLPAADRRHMTPPRINTIRTLGSTRIRSHVDAISLLNLRVDAVREDGGMTNWRVFWVPQNAVRAGVRRRLLQGWEDLPVREEDVGVRAGDPIFLSPDHRVDSLLSLYGQSTKFRGYTAETRRNYATDIRLFLTFLWGRGRTWTEATPRDLEDYEHWRRFAQTNPDRIHGRSGIGSLWRSPAFAGGRSRIITSCVARWR